MLVPKVVHDPPDGLVTNDLGTVAATQVVVIRIAVAVNNWSAELEWPVGQVGRSNAGILVIQDVLLVDFEHPVVLATVGRGVSVVVQRTGPHFPRTVVRGNHAQFAVGKSTKPDTGREDRVSATRLWNVI